MTRPPTENPYWSEYEKPHIFDKDDVQTICVQSFNIILASMASEKFWADDLEELGEENTWEFPCLVSLHQRRAEKELSSNLLKLAVMYRALDDLNSKNEVYTKIRDKQKKEYGSFLTSYGASEVTDSLRECCNKIIHTSDIRYTYSNDSGFRDNGVWCMDGAVELEGSFRKEVWKVSVNLFIFLEAMVEWSEFE